jgi:hypothetical protein
MLKVLEFFYYSGSSFLPKHELDGEPINYDDLHVKQNFSGRLFILLDRRKNAQHEADEDHQEPTKKKKRSSKKKTWVLLHPHNHRSSANVPSSDDEARVHILQK